MTYEDVAEDYWNAMLGDCDEYNDRPYNSPTFDEEYEVCNHTSKKNTEVKPNEELFIGVSGEDVERWTWINEVLGEGSLKGSGIGAEITGVVAGVLCAKDRYGFEFSFWRTESDEKE